MSLRASVFPMDEKYILRVSLKAWIYDIICTDIRVYNTYMRLLKVIILIKRLQGPRITFSWVDYVFLG